MGEGTVYPSKIESGGEKRWWEVTALGVERKPAVSSAVITRGVLLGKRNKTLLYLHALVIIIAIIFTLDVFLA